MIFVAALAGFGCDDGDDAATADSGQCMQMFPDVDGDGLGDARSPVERCGTAAGYVENDDDDEPDCASNDTDVCGICGGDGPARWFADSDGDGLGDPDLAVEACTQPDGFVSDSSDVDGVCADDEADVCGVCGGPGQMTYFADLDADGLGDPTLEVAACEAPDGFVGNADDLDPLCATNDGDICGVCGGAGPNTYWADQDGDGAGDPAVQVVVCESPDGFVAVAGDPEPLCATDNTDSCGVCAGADASIDCLGVCDGLAQVDGCGTCAGGTSAVDPAIDDWDDDARPDACDQCPAVAVERLVVQWTDVSTFDNAGGPYTFQVILHANGDFVFQYEVIEPFEASASFGHQGAGGENGVTLGVNSGYPRDHQVVYFRADEAGGRTEVDYTVPKVWIDISATGQNLELTADGTAQVPLPWAFPYNNAQHEAVTVSANGVIGLSGAMPSFRNGDLSDAGLGAFLAPFWDDLNPTRGGKVSIQLLGAECAKDCDGMFGGVAFEDACGICVGGTSGHSPDDSLDCNGDCNGQAYRDICGECVGGQTGLQPSAEGDCLTGPDLIVDQPYLQQTTRLEYLDTVDQCLIEERCITGVGRRKIIRFGTRIANIGNEDLQLGRPAEGVDHWIYDECHGHFHYEAYAAYDLVDLNTGEVLPIGSKSGFSVIDIGVYDPEIAVNGCVGYNARNQGITAGCQDTYSRNLQCQWVDVTGIADGEYELRVTTNPLSQLFELSYENNAASVRVRMTGDVLDIIDE